MTPEQFVYWLQGYFEISKSTEGLTDEQVHILREHLAKVFNRIDPPTFVKVRVGESPLALNDSLHLKIGDLHYRSC